MNKVDEYIKQFSEPVQKKLEELRAIIKQTAPEATETIAYRMPAYKLKGYVVFFAAFKNHIGFYPLPESIKEFSKELRKYKTARGSVQFPLDQDLPKELIREIVKFRYDLEKNI